MSVESVELRSIKNQVAALRAEVKELAKRIEAASGSEATPATLTMTYADLEEELGISHQTIWKRIAVGKFPRPMRLGHRTVRWRRADIEAWVAGGCRSMRTMDAKKERQGNAPP